MRRPLRFSSQANEAVDFRTSARQGVKWTGASQVIRQILQFVTASILAALLGPSAFGLIGMATVVIGFFQIFNSLGTAAAIVQREQISEELLGSLFWVNSIFGAIVGIAVASSSQLVAAFYKEPQLASIIAVLAINPFLSGPAVVGNALLQRSFRFDLVALIEISSQIIAGAVAIGMAFLDFGVWSLVAQTLLATFFATGVTLALTQWRYPPVLKFDLLRSVWSFSANLTSFNIFNYFARNADYLLVGRFLGSNALGQYTLAYRLMLYPLAQFSAVIGRVMYPVLARLQDDDVELRRVYIKAVSIIALICFPVMTGLFAVARPLIMTVFGSQWPDTITCILILAPVGLLQSVGTTVGAIYMAKGRTDLMLRWGLFAGTITTIAFAIGVQWGIVGVSASYAMSMVILTIPSFVIPFRLINLRFIDLVRQLWPTLICCVAMLVVLTVTSHLLPPNCSNATQLLILIPLGILVYAFASWQWNRAAMNGAFAFVFHKSPQVPVASQ